MTTSSRSTGGPPDVLLIVLDCVRSDLFEATLARDGALPVLRKLSAESLTFPGAVSTASWTVPGHASLFTGLYPWDHGAHYRLGPILTQEPQTLAELLRSQGYATAFYSANAYVQPSTGLTRGFDEAYWGGGREFFLRFLSMQKATCPDLGGPALAWLPKKPGGERPSPIRDFAMNTFTRLPGVWDGMNRVGGRVNGTYADDAQEICPWVEPQVDAWLARQPTDRPAFAFVNLFEAHEPYLAAAGHPLGLRRWMSFATATQDPVLWVNGGWQPSPREIEVVREAYVRSLETIDRRVGQLIDIFRRHDRWENTLFVLTSDHGQAFLERDSLYHRFRVDEPIARIPLWLRTPGARQRGVRSSEWASLVDVPRTIAALVGRDTFGDPAARSLLEPVDSAQAPPVYCMTDGIPAGEAPSMPAARRQLLDRLEVAAYRGNFKGVAREDGTVEVYRVSPSAAPASPEAAAPGSERDAIADVARQALELAKARIASHQYHGSVEHRIAGWGY